MEVGYSVQGETAPLPQEAVPIEVWSYPDHLEIRGRHAREMAETQLPPQTMTEQLGDLLYYIP